MKSFVKIVAVSLYAAAFFSGNSFALAQSAGASCQGLGESSRVCTEKRNYQDFECEIEEEGKCDSLYEKLEPKRLSCYEEMDKRFALTASCMIGFDQQGNYEFVYDDSGLGCSNEEIDFANQCEKEIKDIWMEYINCRSTYVWKKAGRGVCDEGLVCKPNSYRGREFASCVMPDNDKPYGDDAVIPTDTSDVNLDFKPLTCGSSKVGRGNNLPTVVASAPSYTAGALSQETFVPPFISSASAASNSSDGEITELKREAAYLQEQLAEAANKFSRSKAIEDYLLEQYKIAPENEKERLRKEMSDAYRDRKAYQNAFYEARSKYEIAAENLAKAEEKESQINREQTERQFIERLAKNLERWDNEREAAAVRLRQQAEYTDFQQRKQNGSIPQDICYDNSGCKEGEKREEQRTCTYLSFGDSPVFYKYYPYQLSEEELSAMNSVFSYVGLTSFAAGMAVDPSKIAVVKFVIGTVFGYFAGYPLPLDEGAIIDVATTMGQRALNEVGSLQKKLDLVYKIDIPIVITQTQIQETYTSKGEGACHAVEWDKKSVPSVENTETTTVTFACEAVAKRTTSSREDYDDVFNFGNTAETEAVKMQCLPSEDSKAFAESLEEMSARALRIVRDQNNIINSDQCPGQQL